LVRGIKPVVLPRYLFSAQERVAHQKELTALRDGFEATTKEELESARGRIRELQVELEAARGPEGSFSREELQAELEQVVVLAIILFGDAFGEWIGLLLARRRLKSDGLVFVFA
jgi:hypothetical protein